MSETPNNLPLQLSSFIGREREITDVRRLLASARLVTLTGAGGCGKTRLALALAGAAQMSDDYADGVWFIDLAPLSDPALVAQRLASTLNVREQPGQPLLPTLLNVLTQQRLLLVLDNCEHLVEDCAQTARALLQACPQLTILATSREALRVEGEANWLVASLSVPPPLVSTADLSQFESAQLFVARATAAQPQFVLDDRNAAAVADICRRLDGIPLALELSAALVNALSPDQIAARLSDILPLLTEGKRTALPRQQTLEATIAWSHRLLTGSERVLLRRLSVFAGGWSLGAAEAVCGGEDIGGSRILALLIRLVNQSLVLTEERDGETRYRMLETIRQYAHAQLASSGEPDTVQDRRLDFCVRLAEEAAPLISGSTGGAWLKRLEMEHDNLRAALGWSCGSPDRAGSAERGLRLASALELFWAARDYQREGAVWLERLLALTSGAEPLVRAHALAAASGLRAQLGEFMTWRSQAEESLRLFRSLADPDGASYALFILGHAALCQGEYVSARTFLEESLAGARAIGEQLNVVWRLYYLGTVAFLQRDFPAARLLYEECWSLCKTEGAKWCAAQATNGLGDLALREQDYRTAGALYAESLTLNREVESGSDVLRLLNVLGYVARRQGSAARAASLHQESLSLSIKIGFNEGISRAMEMLATFAVEQGQAERAVRLCGAVDALFATQFESPWTKQERVAIGPEPYEHAIAAARAQLGDNAFARAWAAGRALTMAQAVAEANQVTAAEQPGLPGTSPTPANPAGLTPREVEVLRWLVQGLPDIAIAERLTISPHTVHGHLRSIYGKLDVTSRAAAIHATYEMKLV